MNEWKERLSALVALWGKTSMRTRIVAATLLALVVGGGLLVATRKAPTPTGVLFSNLAPEDAAQVVERLREANIPFALDGNGTAILVPEEVVHETRLRLAGEGLPNGSVVGFELFDEQKFGESEFSEQVRYHRALEGELARTVKHIAGVEAARIHLVLPSNSLFATNESGAQASVALRLRPGVRLREEQVRGIVHMVASSVRGLEPTNVTVVDGTGKRLSGGDDEDGEVANDALSYRRALERAKQESIQQMLDTALGPGKTVVRVAADVSFAREERTEEQFDPGTGVTRSFQITEEREGGSAANRAATGATTPPTSVGGVPGAASNLPGGTAFTETNADDQGGIRRRSETRNYEISKVSRHAVEPVGRLTRLNVAVIVDGEWTGTGERKTFKARPAAELARIKALVESAAGVDAQRGDRVTVDCVAFAAQGDDEAQLAETPSQRAINTVSRYWLFIAIGLGVVAVLAVFVMLRRFRKTRELLGPTAIGELRAPIPVRALGSLASSRAAAEDASQEDPNNPSPALLAADVAARDPDLAARVLRGWLAEGGS